MSEQVGIRPISLLINEIVTYLCAVTSRVELKQIRFDRYNRPGTPAAYSCEYPFWASDLFIRYETNFVTLLRRYWAAGLILMMVAVHAAVIGYLRSRVAHVGEVVSTSVELGSFRFQSVEQKSTVYQFDLYAIVDPSQRYHAEERLTQMKMEIHEASEQMLRQVDPQWLTDPAQAQIRRRLMEVVQKYLNEPLVQRVLITNWLELPIQTIGPLTASGPGTTSGTATTSVEFARREPG